MTTKAKKTADYKIISLRRLAAAANIDYMKLYFNLAGRYDSLSIQEKTQLSNAAIDELVPFFETLGFDIKIKRIPTVSVK